MPAGLQFVIDMVDNWRIILGVLATAAFSLFAFLKYAAAHPDAQALVDRTMLRVPYVGALKAQHETARFARTLGSMLKAGVPLLQGLESARAVVADRYLGGQLDTVVEQVRGGANLHTALAHVDKFPTVATQMISIGEEVGKVDEMLMRVAVMFERQTQRSVERVIGLLTPVLTIVIAAVVGGLVMTVMDAVLGINDLASKG
jgi:general secretion pathway protein F